MLPPSTEADPPTEATPEATGQERPARLPRAPITRSSFTLPRPPGDSEMSEATRPAEESPAADPVRRRLRRKTGNLTEHTTGCVFETLGGKDGENKNDLSLRRSSPNIVA